MKCISPALESTVLVDGETDVEVSVSFRLVNTKRKIMFSTPKLLLYTYRQEPKVTSFNPSLCSSRGGCLVDVYGSGFVDSVQMKARIQLIEIQKNNTVGPITLISNRYLDAQVTHIISSSYMKIILPESILGASVSSLAMIRASSNGGVEFSSNGPSLQYQTDMIVKSISPSLIPESGNVRVKIEGQNFVQPYDLTRQYQCAFHGQDGIIVDALWISITELSCMAPSGTVGSSTVQISGNGINRHFTDQVLTLQYFQKHSVQSLEPSIGPESGGTRVTIVGTHFDQDVQLMCLFGHVESSELAVVTNSTHLTCITPHVSVDSMLPSSGLTKVRVLSSFVLEAFGGLTQQLISFEKNYYNSAASLNFTYLSPLLLTSIVPKIGFTSSGSSTVTIFGQHFPDPEQGSADTRAFRSACGCLFTFPKHNTSAVGEISYLRSTSMLCHIPTNIQAQIFLDESVLPNMVDTKVELTLHGQIVSSNALHFVFYTSEPNVTSISPKTGPSAGGSLVRVEGSNFIESENLRCKFGDQTFVLARYLTSSVILCKAPTSPSIGATVTVEVSVNGVSYTSNRLEFRYVAGAVILSAVPYSGPVSGGTNIVVRIENILSNNNNNTYCRFSNSMDGDSVFQDSTESKLSRATIIQDIEHSEISSLACRTPPEESDMLIPSSGKSVTVDLVHVSNGMAPEILSVNSFLFVYYCNCYYHHLLYKSIRS